MTMRPEADPVSENSVNQVNNLEYEIESLQGLIQGFVDSQQSCQLNVGKCLEKAEEEARAASAYAGSPDKQAIHTRNSEAYREHAEWLVEQVKWCIEKADALRGHGAKLEERLRIARGLLQRENAEPESDG